MPSKTLFASILAALAALAVFYAVCGFIAFDWNAANWPSEGRFLFVMAALPAAILMGIMTDAK